MVLNQPRYYLTIDRKVGKFVRISSSKPELYVLEIDGKEKAIRPDFLTFVPEEKLEWFLKRKAV